MKESILHYIWFSKLYDKRDLHTTDNEPVEVVHTGTPNSDAGPDFFNAKIKIGNTLWAGNVEIHIKSSDWYKHHHQTDSNYDNVILHVVKEADTDIKQSKGEKIPQLQLNIPQHILNNYGTLVQSQKWISCEDKVSTVDEILIYSFIEKMLIERLKTKTEAIEVLLKDSENNWEQAFYISLARSFGFGLNSDAFERLARKTPLSILAKHKDQIFQLEALLLGQAGFLEESQIDDYHNNLKKEYTFLQKKYQLKSLKKADWKYLRLRPDNFPIIRIVQFAQLIHYSNHLFSKIIELKNLKELRQLLQFSVSEYWQKHYSFGKPSTFSRKRMGRNSVDILIINTIVPYLFLYSLKNNITSNRALELLKELPPEENNIIRKWKKQGIEVENAGQTQALLHIYKNYCTDKKCFRCTIGHKVLTQKIYKY